MNQEARTPPSPLVWWTIWLALIAGVIVLWKFLGSGANPPATGAIRYLPIGPLAVSSLVRWLVLPRFADRTRAFPVFVVGLALAESCAILGLFLVPDLRDTYVLLGLLGLAQFAPVFASKLR
jgi:hypothetical protein